MGADSHVRKLEQRAGFDFECAANVLHSHFWCLPDSFQIAAIRRTVKVTTDETTKLQVITGVASSREAAIALIEKYGDRPGWHGQWCSKVGWI